MQQLVVRRQFVQLLRLLFKVLERPFPCELDDVAGGGIDEITDRIVAGVQHAFDVDQLEKDHQTNHQHRVIRSAHVTDVVIHLVGH